jgi:hypothetical protein
MSTTTETIVALPSGNPAQGSDLLYAVRGGTTDYSLTVASVLALIIFSEIPSGAVNGTNVTFTLSKTPISMAVFQNGDRLSPTTDYSFSGATITLVTAPPLDDELLVDYTA